MSSSSLAEELNWSHQHNLPHFECVRECERECVCVPVCFSKDKINWGGKAFYSEEGTSVAGSAKCMIAFKSTREY